MPFNGVGYNTTDINVLNPGELTDSLSPGVRANPNAFRWINHTWDHTSLDPEGGFTPTVASIVSQLTQNHEVATGCAVGSNGPAVPGDVCQLRQGRLHPARHLWPGEPSFLGCREELWSAVHPDGHVEGVRVLYPRPARDHPARWCHTTTVIPPNTGFYSSLDTSNPRIFIIPRYPTNLFYNDSTPAEWVSEYNSLWRRWIRRHMVGLALTQPMQQILDREAEVLVRYMLKFNVNSWMFHAANLRDLRRRGARHRKSLLSDLLDAVANNTRPCTTCRS